MLCNPWELVNTQCTWEVIRQTAHTSDIYVNHAFNLDHVCCHVELSFWYVMSELSS